MTHYQQPLLLKFLWYCCSFSGGPSQKTIPQLLNPFNLRPATRSNPAWGKILIEAKSHLRHNPTWSKTTFARCLITDPLGWKPAFRCLLASHVLNGSWQCQMPCGDAIPCFVVWQYLVLWGGKTCDGDNPHRNFKHGVGCKLHIISLSLQESANTFVHYTTLVVHAWGFGVGKESCERAYRRDPSPTVWRRMDAARQLLSRPRKMGVTTYTTFGSGFIFEVKQKDLEKKKALHFSVLILKDAKLKEG